MICLVFSFVNIYVIRTVMDNMIITIFYIGFLVVCLLAMVAINIRMLVFLKRRQNQRLGTQQHRCGNSKHYNEAVYTLLTIAVVASLSSLPLVILQLYIIAQTLGGNTAQAHRTLVNYTQWACLPFLFNSGFNANIYVVRNKDIRLFYQNQFSCCWKKRPFDNCAASNQSQPKDTVITNDSSKLHFSHRETGN